MTAIAEEEMVDAVLHLDHARDSWMISKKQSIADIPVMYDGSHLPFKRKYLEDGEQW